MGFLQDLPTQEQFTSILQGVIGDPDSGTGVAGVLRLLEQLDAPRLSGDLQASLGQTVSANIQVDPSGLTSGALRQFQAALASFPSDPSSLVGPLADRFANLRELSVEELTSNLSSGVAGLQELEQLFPPDVRKLLGQAGDRLAGVKGEFINGAFGELRQWSAQLEPLRAELEPLVAGGEGSIEERLLGYLRQKIADLLALVLPEEINRLPILLAQIDANLQSPPSERILSLKAAVIAAMQQARVEFDAGNFTNTAQFQAAAQSFNDLVQALVSVSDFIRHILERLDSGVEGLLSQQYDYFKSIEIVDLGNIREHFSQAIAQVEELLDDLNLESVKETVESMFNRLNEVIDRFQLRKLLEQVGGLQEKLDSLLDALDSGLFEVVATIRGLFEQLRQALRDALSALGTFDENGQFHFTVQDEIEGFLTGVQDTINQTVKPMLEDFRSTIRESLEQVQAVLGNVRQEIEGVKNQLQETLQGMHRQLQSIDVAGTMERIRSELDAMLNALGQIDFDPVVDPVIAQINEMRDALASIDVSSLNEFTIGALKVSVEVVVQLDFSTQITDALMTEIDSILQIPEDALAEVEGQVEGALQRFGELAPATILAPLYDLFDPVRTGLDALNLQALLEPLDRWYQELLDALEQVSPASLLQPLVDLHAELISVYQSVSPAALLRPLRDLVSQIKAQIQAIDLSSITTQLGELVGRVRATLEAIAPDRLLNPLVSAFDKVMAALDSFDPAVLLEPLKGIWETITDPLENLSAENAVLISQIFAPLRELLALFDPRQLFRRLAGAFNSLRELVAGLNLGGLIADLKTPYDAMQGSFAAHGGGANVSLSASVEGLNPLRHPQITQAAADFRDFQTRLEALARGEPPAALVQRYEAEIKPVLEKIVPLWARENITAASIRRAFQLINPFGLENEVRQLYQALKDKLRVFDPRVIQEGLRQVFDRLLESLNQLSPEGINQRVQSMLQALTQRLDALDLEMIARELESLGGEIQALLEGLNPRPIIERLQALAQTVLELAGSLKPSELLAELEQPFQAAKAIVMEFDPAIFKEALQEVFGDIQDLLKQIDIGILLQPLVERLEQLRSELESNLRRTEVAFNGMLAAIPV